MTCQDIFNYCFHSIKSIYPEREAREIIFYLLEMEYDIKRTDLITKKNISLTGDQKDKINAQLKRLMNKEPVQYITHTALFCGMPFYVDSNVLIPRPETEELVQLSIELIKNVPSPVMIDMCTGSGCIAIALKKKLPHATVYAVDVCKHALSVAEVNSRRHNTNIYFMCADVLNATHMFPSCNLIVSNPPYVCDSEKADMDCGVLHYEPHKALFVRDNDPLIFYRALAHHAQRILTSGGILCVEINRRFGKQVKLLFEKNSFTGVTLIQDIHHADRFVVAKKS